MGAKSSRTLAENGFDRNPLEEWMSFNQPMFAAVTELNGRFIEHMTRANKEWLGFVNRRLSEDMAASQRFLECRTMQDLFAAYSEFFQRAQQQYQAEVQHFARFNQKLADDTASVIKSHINNVEAEVHH